MLLLDSHVLLWSRFDDRRLGRRATRLIVSALEEGDAGVSAMTFWEIAMFLDKGRIELLADISTWRTDLLDSGLSEIPVDGEIAARAGALPGLPGDPADRIIVATATAGHQLMTADDRILEWNGNLLRLDARE